MDDVPAPFICVRVAYMHHRVLKTIPHIEGDSTSIRSDRVSSVETGHKVISREFAALGSSVEPGFCESYEVREVQRLQQSVDLS